MKKQGFTLVELIIVIVILGILSVTALPRFIDTSKESKIAVLKEIEAEIKAAYSLAHKKAVIEGKTTGSHELSIGDNETIRLAHGYPVPADLEKILTVSSQLTPVVSNHFPNYPVLVYYFSEAQNPALNTPPFPLPNQGEDCFVMYSVSDVSIAPYAGTRIMTNGC